MENSNNCFRCCDFMGFHANTNLMFTDGRTATMKEVVNQKMQGKVWTYNEELGELEEQEIIGWHYNGKIENFDDYICVETAGADTVKRRPRLALTKNSKVLTRNGWKMVQDLVVGDEIMSQYNSVINGTLGDFMWGMFASNIGFHHRNGDSLAIQFKSNSNPDYVKWRADKLSAAYTVTFKDNGCWTNQTYELAQLQDVIVGHDPCLMLRDHYSDMGLAIWFMDSARRDPKNRHGIILSVKRFKGDVAKIDEIIDLLSLRGIGCSNVNYNAGSIYFNKSCSSVLCERICRFFPECVQHKLLDEYKGKYVDFHLSHETEVKRCFLPIVELSPMSANQELSLGKYMVSVKNGNVLAGHMKSGVVVKCETNELNAWSSRGLLQGDNLSHQMGGVAFDVTADYIINNQISGYGNNEGGTMRELFERFHDIRQDQKVRINRSDATFVIPTMTKEEYIADQCIIDVATFTSHSCYRVTTESGNTIIATGAQGIYVGNGRFESIENLRIGDNVCIYNKTHLKPGRSAHQHYKRINVGFHPNGIFQKQIKNGKRYKVLVSHLVYEAHMNRMEYEEYVDLLNTADRETILTLWFVDMDKYEIHHKDHNRWNNTLNNLELLEKKEHGRLHFFKRKKELSFIIVEDSVANIETIDCGVQMFCVTGPTNGNYVANGFVLACQKKM